MWQNGEATKALRRRAGCGRVGGGVLVGGGPLAPRGAIHVSARWAKVTASGDRDRGHHGRVGEHGGRKMVGKRQAPLDRLGDAFAGMAEHGRGEHGMAWHGQGIGAAEVAVSTVVAVVVPGQSRHARPARDAAVVHVGVVVTGYY